MTSTRPKLLEFGYPAFQFRHAYQDGAAFRSPAPGLPEGNTPIEQGAANGGRADRSGRLHTTARRPAGVHRQTLDSEPGIVQRGPLADVAGHPTTGGVLQNLPFGNEPISISEHQR